MLLFHGLLVIFKACLYTIIMNNLAYYKYSNSLEIPGSISIVKVNLYCKIISINYFNSFLFVQKLLSQMRWCFHYYIQEADAEGLCC